MESWCRSIDGSFVIKSWNSTSGAGKAHQRAEPPRQRGGASWGVGVALLTDLRTWHSKPFSGIGRLLIYPSTGGPLRAAGGRDAHRAAEDAELEHPPHDSDPRNCSWGPRNIHCRRKVYRLLLTLPLFLSLLLKLLQLPLKLWGQH
jgi:hypothetical protein